MLKGGEMQPLDQKQPYSEAIKFILKFIAKDLKQRRILEELDTNIEAFINKPIKTVLELIGQDIIIWLSLKPIAKNLVASISAPNHFFKNETFLILNSIIDGDRELFKSKTAHFKNEHLINTVHDLLLNLSAWKITEPESLKFHYQKPLEPVIVKFLLLFIFNNCKNHEILKQISRQTDAFFKNPLEAEIKFEIDDQPYMILMMTHNGNLLMEIISDKPVNDWPTVIAIKNLLRYQPEKFQEQTAAMGQKKIIEAAEAILPEALQTYLIYELILKNVL